MALDREADVAKENLKHKPPVQTDTAAAMSEGAEIRVKIDKSGQGHVPDSHRDLSSSHCE